MISLYEVLLSQKEVCQSFKNAFKISHMKNKYHSVTLCFNISSDAFSQNLEIENI